MTHGYAAQRKSYCDRTAAGEKAREILGQECFDRFAQVAARLNLYKPWDFMDTERAQNLAKAELCVKRAARAMKEARELVGPPTGAIPDGVSIEELRTLVSAVTEAEKAAQIAVRAIPAGLRVEDADAEDDLSERQFLKIPEDIFAPHPQQPVAAIGACYADGYRYVVAPAFFARKVFRAWPEMPTNATAWAYAAIACGLSEPITDGANYEWTKAEWNKLVASWQQTIKRELAEKPPSRARKSSRHAV